MSLPHRLPVRVLRRPRERSPEARTPHETLGRRRCRIQMNSLFSGSSKAEPKADLRAFMLVFVAVSVFGGAEVAAEFTVKAFKLPHGTHPT